MRTALAEPSSPTALLAQRRRPTHWVACPHTLGGLPCMNRRPHAGNGRGCVHYSTSGVLDRHALGGEE